jgi:hypothetical protein
MPRRIPSNSNDLAEQASPIVRLWLLRLLVPLNADRPTSPTCKASGSRRIA